MEEIEDKIDFDEIARIVDMGYEEHKEVIKDSCIKSTITPLSEYNETLQKEYKIIENCTTPQKSQPNPLESADLLKAFDEYPPNIPKPKKQSTRDNPRSHPSAKSSKSNTSSSSINLSSKSPEEQPSADEVYSEFLKFTDKVGNFEKKLSAQANSKQYNEMLDHINTFAKELEKLSLLEDDGDDAFTEKEEEKIRNISKNIDHFAFIQENQDLYSNLSTNETSSEKLNDLVDITTDALVGINSYKP